MLSDVHRQRNAIVATSRGFSKSAGIGTAMKELVALRMGVHGVRVNTDHVQKF